MRILLAVLLILNPLQSYAFTAKHPIVFKTPLQSSVVAQGDYEDIRVDSNGDQKIDLWVVKNKNVTVSMKFKGNFVSTISIRKIAQNKIQEVTYSYQNHRYLKTFSATRPLLVMNGTQETNACVEQNKSVLTKLADFKNNLTQQQTAIAASKAITCENGDMAAGLESALTRVLSNQDFTDCIKGDAVLTTFGKENSDALIYYSNKMKLDLKKIATQQDGKELISCKVSDEKTALKGQFIEEGKIQIAIPKDMDADKLAPQLQPLLFHELLHRSGLSDEAVTEKIISLCVKDAHAAPMTSQDNVNLSAHSTSINVAISGDKVAKASAADTKETVVGVKKANRNIASTAADTGGGADNVNMKQEIASAEVQQAVPSASQLAVTSSDTSPEGAAQSVANSQRQSAPVFAMADRAMGAMNTPALASDDTSSSSPSSSSSRSTAADRYQSRYNGYQATATGSSKNTDDSYLSKGMDSATRSNLRVVEEVDLTKGSASQIVIPTNNAAPSGNSRVVNAGRSGAVAASTGNADVADGAAPANTGRTMASAGSAATFYADGSSGRKTNASSRRPASSGASGGYSDTSRDEIITFISNANYSQTKNKLRDQSFQQTLANSQISIIYSDGSDPIGAKQGTTIFLDDGSRFIMQRRK